jgi:hypothetical protein
LGVASHPLRYFRHVTRIMFVERQRTERLASIVGRLRCTRCRDLDPQVDLKIGYEMRHPHEKLIRVVGNRVVKVGMT